MNRVKLTHDKLSVDEATEIVTSPKCGAVSLFVGTTRDNFEKKKVWKIITATRFLLIFNSGSAAGIRGVQLDGRKSDVGFVQRS